MEVTIEGTPLECCEIGRDEPLVLVHSLEELLPRAERVEIPAASHMMHENNPTAYNRAVLSFLGEHRGAA